jgi:beta-mannosidase
LINIWVGIISNRFAKEVFLSTEDGEGFFSDNFFDLIPDIPVKIVFSTYNNVDVDNVVKAISLVDSY